MMFDRLATSIRVSGLRAVLAAACFSTCGMAFAGERPALIDGASAEAPGVRPVLGDAEQRSRPVVPSIACIPATPPIAAAGPARSMHSTYQLPIGLRIDPGTARAAPWILQEEL